MAGEGRRFRDIGFTIPKHMIIVKGKTLFWWSISSLKNYFESQFIFIARNEPGNSEFIKNECRNLGIKSFRIIELSQLTKGQAETALKAQEAIDDPNEEIMIYNIDTYVEAEALPSGIIKGQGWVPAFHAEGDKWSFVKFKDDFTVTEITEKIRISQYGTIGLYYFKSFSLFKECYEKFKWGGYKEEYIAPIYNIIIKDPKMKLYTCIIPEKYVHVLGTPQDVVQFWPEFSKVIDKMKKLGN